MSNERMSLIAFGLVIVTLIGVGLILWTVRPTPVQITIRPPDPTETPSPTQTPAPIEVYVTGAVSAPQTVVSLPVGSRVGDAISGAGGASANADLQRVNLAAILTDGDQVHVPSIGETDPIALPTDTRSEIININQATQAELETLPGIGPSLAARIIAYRTENGRITDLDDLDNVSGIGPALLEDLRDRIAFD
ncbi:MAG: ComEA family DNA-binding protein [Anaerolineae bacterium]|jgi:competence protein ComEA|nr:ComEA family DNA-binding protein [Anaerolineae bacterium]